VLVFYKRNKILPNLIILILYII